jgi:hypothetical protein
MEEWEELKERQKCKAKYELKFPEGRTGDPWTKGHPSGRSSLAVKVGTISK